MGNTFIKKLKVELYKWSSSEFPVEWALIYTSLDDESETCTLQLSINREKVLFRLADNLCKDHPTVRVHMKFTAERDSKGDMKFGEVIVGARGTRKNRAPQDALAYFMYLCCDKRGGYSTVTPIHQNIGRVNLKKTTWEVSHSCDLGIRTMLRYYASIQCDKVKGLYVEFSGPFIYKGLVFKTRQGLQSPREVFGEPPKALNTNVEIEFEEEEEYIIFPRRKANQNNGTLPSGQVRGLVNNISGQTHGNFNGCVINNSRIYSISIYCLQTPCLACSEVTNNSPS